MKLRSLNNIFIFIFFLVAFCTLALFAVPSGSSAEAAAFGTLTVTFDGEKYLYSDGKGIDGSDVSLQNIIDYAEQHYSNPVIDLDRLTVKEPLIFKKSASLQGSLNCELASDGYAMTVKSNATLTLQGVVLNSNQGAVRVEYNGNLRLLSGSLTVIDSTSSRSYSAVDAHGNVYISGGEIIYSGDNRIFGYGLSVNSGGNLTVEPEAPVKIEGHSGLCITAGKAVINGGRYIANRLDGNTSTGFSIDLQGGELTVNDGEFPQPIFDRAISSENIAINGGNVSSIRITPNQNKKLNVGSLEIFAGIYCNSEIRFLSANTVTVQGFKSSDGFKTVGFTVNGEKNGEAILTVNTDRAKTVVPIEDNRYSLNLLSDGNIYKTLSYPYGTTVKLDSLPAPEKKGYTLLGWEEAKIQVTLEDDVNLNAVLVLSDAEIVINGTELTYNETEQTITPLLKHDLTGVSYVTFWERLLSGGWEKISDGTELKVTTVADSGEYRFTAIAAYGADESSAVKEVTVTVNKGKYKDISHPGFSGVYDPSNRLTSYALQPDFRWLKPTTVPTVPIKFYPAIYNADQANYYDLELEINIELQKAAAVTAPPHANLSGVYEKKQLKEYPLRDGFHWQSPSDVPVVKTKYYPAFYNPDIDNYEDSIRHIILDLKKGCYDNSKRLDDMTITYRPNYSLSDFGAEYIKENYRLVFSSNKKLNAGNTELECVYNDDAENYEDYTFTFILTVKKADVSPSDIPQIPSVTGVYSGLPLSEYPLPENVFWRNPELIPTVNVQEYEAFYNSERENYNDYPIKITMILQKGSYDLSSITVPTLNAIGYNKDTTLSDIALPSGWSWLDPSVNPTVAVNEYQAEYCGDRINYLPVAVLIPLTVKKADIQPAVLPDKTVTYDGKAHSLDFEYLPYPLELVKFENNERVDAGRYEVTARLLQTDTDNYNTHPSTVRGILTILKAPSAITAPTRYDILEGTKLVIKGTVENEEQNLVIPEFTETAVGVYSITLTTAESGNYLAGSLIVTVSINKSEKYIGNIKYPANYDGSYLYGILVNSESGVPNDAEITFRPFACENYLLGMEISVIVDGAAFSGKFTAKIRMTNEMLSARSLSLYSEDGTEIVFYVENGVYLAFETDGNDVFYLKAEFDKKFAWYWIPIGIGIGIVVIGLALMILWKKGIIKLPKKAKVQKKASVEIPEEATEKIAEDVAVNKEIKEQSNEKSDLEG